MSIDIDRLAPLLAREFGKAGFFAPTARMAFLETQARLMLLDVADEYDRERVSPLREDDPSTDHSIPTEDNA